MINGYYLMPHPPIMIPEVGKGEELKINNTLESVKAIGKEIEQNKIDTIIIITPHGVVFRDGIGIILEDTIKGDLIRFGAKDVIREYKIDKEIVNDIIKIGKEENIPFVPLTKESEDLYNIKLELDHGALVPLYNIQKDIKIVHINYGLLPYMELYKAGKVIEKAIRNTDKNLAIIASGDLSHKLKASVGREYSPQGKIFDEFLLGNLEEGNVEEIFKLDSKIIEEAGECALRSIYILLGIMDECEFQGELLSYEGTFGVGYGVMKFLTTRGSSKLEKINSILDQRFTNKISRGSIYTKLARSNLDYYFNKGKLLEDIPGELLKKKAGVFVSLKKSGELRGCIGTIFPMTNSIGEEIIRNSISAALNDPRFPPVNKGELRDIDISVDVLGEIESCERKDLDPKKYGVIVSCIGKRGLLLPNLEGIDSIEQQLSIALQKAGIDKDDHYDIERFKVERYVEGE